MTTEQFAYWMKGFFEISDSKKLTEKQVQIIKDHLDLVFTKVTPDRNGEKEGFKKIVPDFDWDKWNDYKNNPLEPPYTVTCDDNGLDKVYCSSVVKPGSDLIC
jgi:acyl-CoA-binding protein